MCGDQWSVNEIENSVSYGETEICDELESELIRVDTETAEKLLAMKNSSPAEVASFFSFLNSNNFIN